MAGTPDRPNLEARDLISLRHLGPNGSAQAERGSSLSLFGRKAAVTGVLGSIPGAIAERLALSGADLVIHGREKHEKGLIEVATNLQSMGVGVEIAMGDLANPETGEAIAKAANGNLDILVNAAGITKDRPIKNESPDDARKYIEAWREVAGANIDGVIFTTLASVELLKAAPRGRGRIINISSIVAEGHRYQTLYGATKGAVNSFTLSLADELAEDQVTVNGIAPGAVRSKIWRVTEFAMRRAQSEEDKAAGVHPLSPIMRKTPLLGGDRFITPEEVAAPVLWLAGDYGRVITRQIIRVEAGITALSLG